MIYLDNSATSFPKPDTVIRAVDHCLRDYCANSGRGGHSLSRKAGHAVYSTRERLADFFSIPDPFRVIFTSGATESLNLGLKGALKKGDHVITTSMEHNSILRPLSSLGEEGVEVTILKCPPNGKLDKQQFCNAIRPNTKMLACTHASNLTGSLNPIKELGAICHEKGILFLVDAAQTAGIELIHVQEMYIDLLAVPGHKGLYGLPGAGFLYVSERTDLKEWKQGGTGSKSEQITQPLVLPDRYESGTLNLPGIVAMDAGLRFVQEEGTLQIKEKELSLWNRLLEGASSIKGSCFYGQPDPNVDQLPILALNLAGITPAELAYTLDHDYEICTRGGLHCAPFAHNTVGSGGYGAVRFSIGYFNTRDEIDNTLAALNAISNTRCK